MQTYLAFLLPLLFLLQDARVLQAEVPFVDDRTLGILRINTEGIDFTAIKKMIDRGLPIMNEEFPPPELKTQMEFLKKNGIEQLTFYFSLDDLPQSVFAVGKLAEGKDVSASITRIQEGNFFPPMIWKVIKNQLVLGNEATLNRLVNHKPVDRPDLTKAIDALPSGALQLAFSMPADSRRLAEETLPRLPENLGGGSIKLLTRGLQFISVGLEMKPELVFRGNFQAADNESSQALQTLWSRTLKMVAAQPDVVAAMPKLAEHIARLTPEVDEDRLRLRIEPGQLLDLMARPIADARMTAKRLVSINNLKQLALAFHISCDAKGTFPAAAIVDKTGKKLLSWRVAILPYLEQEALYKEFHLDEPWDSDHNKKLIPRMPRFYQSPVRPELTKDFKTCYLLPVGKETAHPGDKGLKITNILDGTSITIMILESSPEAAVVWTKPDDIDVDPKDPYKGIGMEYGKGFLTAFCDGSVQFLSNKITPRDLYSYFTCAGGEVIGPLPGEQAPRAEKPVEEPAVPNTQAAARRQTMNNLKQFGLAFHNYAADNKGFPAAAIADKNGKKLLSWRVAILPYLNEQKLHKEFHLDEPWDSEHNKTLIARMPKIYAPLSSPESAKNFKTCYLVPVGKETAHPGNKGRGLIEITDGTSNTILMVEVMPDAAVVWTKPDDLEVDPRDPFKKLSTYYGDGVMVCLCDGSVRMISKKVKPEWLWAYFTASGGEVIPADPQK